jgi:hypothetical protein
VTDEPHVTAFMIRIVNEEPLVRIAAALERLVALMEASDEDDDMPEILPKN